MVKSVANRMLSGWAGCAAFAASSLVALSAAAAPSGMLAGAFVMDLERDAACWLFLKTPA